MLMVAPRAGAWIETFSIILLFIRYLSPLARGRGLKPNGDGTFKFVPCRRPSRGGVD